MTKTPTKNHKAAALKQRERVAMIYSLDNDEEHFSTYIKTCMNKRLLSPRHSAVKVVLDFAKRLHSCQ